MVELNDKLQELIDLLEKEESVKKIKELKSKIGKKELELINEYRSNPTLDNKNKLYNNDIIKEYLKNETQINYLIMGINRKFKGGRKCQK